MKFFNLIISLIFPKKCIFCKSSISESESICTTCYQNIEFLLPPFCKICGKKAKKIYDEKYNYVENFCLTCIKHNKNEFNLSKIDEKTLMIDFSNFENFNKKYYLSGISSGIEYNDFIKKNILKFKYSKNEDEAKKFAKIFAKFLPTNFINQSDFIIPVPIHKERFKKRKYNQSVLLIYALKKIYSGKFPKICENILIKNKNTTPQKGKNKKEREKNVEETISINKKKINSIKSKNILIIDDVIGSGATLNECAKILKNNGAKNIFGTSISKSNKKI